jgi:hypothetical protein
LHKLGQLSDTYVVTRTSKLPDIHIAAPLLRELDLSQNAFSSFPPQLWNLQSLEVPV